MGVDLQELISGVYDMMRLVDPLDKLVWEKEVENKFCYEIWGKNEMCANCVSIRAIKESRPISKLETTNNDIFLVHAIPIITTQKNKVVLEVIKKMTELTVKNQEMEFDLFSMKELVEKINRVMYIDKLTGAYNREYLENTVPLIIGKNAQEQKDTSIIMLDLDDFKMINDHHGHLAGDEILVHLVQQIKVQLRSSDALIRFGGDEFIIVLPGVSKEVALRVGKRISESISNDKSFLDKYQLNCSCSIGIYTFNDNEELNDIINKADAALYHSKKTGKSLVTHFDDL